MGFLAIDPARATDLAFTAPYVIIKGTYLVRSRSPLSSIDDFDREGIRIAAGKTLRTTFSLSLSLSLSLSRTLKHATVVHAATSAAAIELFIREELEAAAGVRQPLLAFSAANPGLRVIDGRFQVIEQAMAMPKDRNVAGGA